MLFAGDALCTWNPVTGKRGHSGFPSAMNVSNVQALESLGLIETLDAQVVLPGHGEPYRGSPAAAVASPPGQTSEPGARRNVLGGYAARRARAGRAGPRAAFRDVPRAAAQAGEVRISPPGSPGATTRQRAGSAYRPKNIDSR